MKRLVSESAPLAREGGEVRQPNRWRSITGAALAVSLLAGAWIAAPGQTPASAVENEEYTYAHVNRTPAGAGNEPATWFVYARAGETVTIGAGSHRAVGDPWDVHLERAFYTITDPQGGLVATNEALGGYPSATPARELGASMLEPATQPAPFVVPAGGDGIYRLAIRGATRNWNLTRFPWSVVVSDASGTEQTGRTWVETYRMVEQWPKSLGISEVEKNGLDLDYWFVSEQGYEYELKLNGFVGWNSIIEASLLGNTDKNCVSQYHSVVDMATINTECNDRYNTFFEQPSDDLPATAAIAVENASLTNTQVGVAQKWVKPQIGEPKIVLDAYAEAGNAAVPKAGTLDYSLDNFAGNYSILIDADGDGSFEGELDRKIPLSVTRDSGSGDAAKRLSFDFDGLDAKGNAIPASVSARISVFIEHYAELHFVFGDVEQLAGGLSLTRTNGGGDPAEDLVYWNDSEPSTTPGGDPTLLGEQACGPADQVPTAGNPRNPIVNLEGMKNVAGIPGLRYWGTDLGSAAATQACRDDDSPITGSYGNEKLLDTWSYADVSVDATALIIGPALVVAKQADVDTAIASSPIGYTVTGTNTGSADLSVAEGSPAVVKDNLGGADAAARVSADSLKATVGGVPVAAPAIIDGGLTWVGDLRAGETVEIRYDMTVAADGSSGTAITNRAAALRDETLPIPGSAECAAAATAPTYDCVSVTTAVASGPTVLDAKQQVAPGKSVSFDVLGELVSAGASPDLVVALIDPVTGQPTAETSLVVAGGVWTLDPATGIVSFAAGADFDGSTPPIGVRVTDANGFTADAALTVSLLGASTPGDDVQGKPGTKPEISETGGGSMLALGGAAALLLLAGAALSLRRARVR